MTLNCIFKGGIAAAQSESSGEIGDGLCGLAGGTLSAGPPPGL